MKYKTLYIDPPWPEFGGGKIKRGADRHYPLMSEQEILALPVRNLSEENCHLYLWVTNNYLPLGLRCIERWGFRYVTKVTWVKINRMQPSSDQFGLGQYFRGITEDCLFAVRGNLPYRTRDDGKRAQGKTVIMSPRREHSQKPDEMRTMIELVSHEPRLELFARNAFTGWDVWGRDCESSIEIINGVARSLIEADLPQSNEIKEEFRTLADSRSHETDCGGQPRLF